MECLRRSGRWARPFLLLLCLGSFSCSLPSVRKLSPEAYARINQSNEKLDNEVAQAKGESQRIRQEVKQQTDALDKVIPMLAQPEFNTLTPLPLESHTDLKEALKAAELEPGDRVPSSLLEEARTKREAVRLRVDRATERVNRAERASQEVRDARADGIDVATDGAPFFAFTPVVAFRGGLHGTAIPAVTANVQPFDFGTGNAAKWLNPLGIQAIFGGALNPSNESSGPSAAVGAGLWYPIGSAGSIAVGYALWEDGSDTRSGVYVGLNLGQSTKKVDPNP